MPFSTEAAELATGFIESLRLSDGEWAGKQFKLMDWQRQLVEKLFGTLRDDGLRQYRLVYIEIPKKNGKSGLAAGIALKMLTADREPGAEVYGAAVDRKQAGVVFEEAMKMVRKSKRLSARCRVRESTKVIAVLKTGSKYEAVSADVQSKHGIKPHAIIFDEIHAAKSRKLYDILTKGSTAARRQPLIFVITTAGESKTGIAWELHERAVAKLAKMESLQPGDPEPDPTFLPVVFGIAEGDDWEDEEVWKRVNPSIGHTIPLEVVRQEYNEAVGKPIDEAYFRQLRLDEWGTPTIERWLPITVWDQVNDIPVDVKALAGRKCYGGLDLSETQDLTGWVMLFPKVDDPEAVEVLARIWCPAARIHDRRNPNRELYQRWAREGHIIPTSGNAIDFDHIRDHVKADAKAFKLVDVNMDKQFQGTQIQMELQSAGIKALEFRQGFLTYGKAMRELERRLLKGKILHGGNPALRWMFENLLVERDAANNLKPNKPKSSAKIDGLVALIMALARVAAHGAKKQSKWKY